MCWISPTLISSATEWSLSQSHFERKLCHCKHAALASQDFPANLLRGTEAQSQEPRDKGYLSAMSVWRLPFHYPGK